MYSFREVSAAELQDQIERLSGELSDAVDEIEKLNAMIVQIAQKINLDCGDSK